MRRDERPETCVRGPLRKDDKPHSFHARSGPRLLLPIRSLFVLIMRYHRHHDRSDCFSITFVLFISQHTRHERCCSSMALNQLTRNDFLWFFHRGYQELPCKISRRNSWRFNIRNFFYKATTQLRSIANVRKNRWCDVFFVCFLWYIPEIY